MRPCIQIIFNGEAGVEPLALRFQVAEKPIARKWLSALKEELQQEHTELDACFFAFPCEAGEERARQKIVKSVNVINEWTPGRIPFSPGTVLDQEQLNFLHLHFEQMTGAIDQPNQYYLDAPDPVRKALGDLNDTIHELEMYGYKSPRLTVRSGNCKRFPMDDEDFPAFSFERNFGDIVLMYCQLGKQIMDAWIENDQHVTRQNLRPLHHYSAQFELYLRKGLDTNQQRERYELMHDWLVEKGYDPADPKLSLGWIVLARLDRSGPLGEMSQKEIVQKIGERQKFISIQFDDESGAKLIPNRNFAGEK